ALLVWYRLVSSVAPVVGSVTNSTAASVLDLTVAVPPAKRTASWSNNVMLLPVESRGTALLVSTGRPTRVPPSAWIFSKGAPNRFRRAATVVCMTHTADSQRPAQAPTAALMSAAGSAVPAIVVAPLLIEA